MATSPDGILEAAFDPARNLTRLVVDGGMWPVPGVLRTNLHPDPRATAVAGLWGYQPGTSELAPTTLMTAASPKRTNLVKDPRATASWSGTAVTYETSGGPTGVPTWAKHTLTAAGTGTFRTVVQSNGLANFVAVQPGFTYRAQADVIHSHTPGTRASLYVTWYDSAGTSLGQPIAAQTPGPNGRWYTTLASFTAPAGAAYARLGVSVGSDAGWPAGAYIGATKFMMLDDTSVLVGTDYLDGTTPGGSWSGAANNSVSTQAVDDGPIAPDGSRISTYIRRTVTAAKTGGSSGPFCRTPASTLAIVPGDTVTPTMYVRFSVEVTLTVQSSVRSGSGLVTSTITTRTVPAYTWARVGQPVTATAAGDNTQVWATLPAGAVLPVGTVIDQTGGQVERGEPTPYFDGNTLPAGSVIRYWTGAPNASSSVEELMAGPVSRVLIERSSPGVATEPVRTANGAPAAGGWFLGADDAAPMDTTCTYTVSGLDEYGGIVATSSVAVETTGAEWGLWLKAPGRPQLTCRVTFRAVGERASATQGGVYQVPGGGSIPQWSGVNSESLSIEIATETDGDRARLDALLRTERVLLIQSGQPEEIPSGYYFVTVGERSNPGQMRSDEEPYRVTTLELTATSAPVGEGQGFTGTTYETVRQTYATYQDVVDGNATYFDVYAGEGV